MAFAQAGTSYASAVDTFLVVVRDTSIDASSERLIGDQRVLAGDNGRLSSEDGDQLIESLDSWNKQDQQRIQLVGRLRSHGRLLARYFQQLGALAQSDASGRMQTAIQGTATQLNTIGEALRGSPIIAGDGNPFALAGNVAVDFAIRGALRSELNARKDVIRAELTTQRVLLGALENAIAHNTAIAQQAREKRDVIEPLGARTPISKPERWIDSRRSVLLASARLEELRSAKSAAGDLENAFDRLIAGKIELRELVTLTDEMQGLQQLAQLVLDGL